MTISSENNQISYTGNGATTAFSFPYAFQAEGDLVVIETVIATGVQTTKTLTTDYTVSGTADAQGFFPDGGTVTFGTAPASTVTITIFNDPDATQTLDLVENDPLPAESLEAALDRLTMIAQRLKKVVQRSIRQPTGDTTDIDTLPAKVDRASKYLAFNADGDPIASEGTTDATVISSFMATVLDDTTAAAARTTLGAGTGDVPSTRTITAGSGLTGGGDLSANRALALSVNGLTQVVPALTDMVAGADASDSNNNKKFSVLAVAGRTPRAKFSYAQTSGTGGGNATTGAWTKYPLTEESDPDAIATVASNVITLAAGTYIARGCAAFAISNGSVLANLRLRETTGSTTVGIGVPGAASDGGVDSTTVVLPDTKPFTTDGTKTYELQYYATASVGTPTLGTPSSSGENEQYGSLTIEKIAD